MIILALYYTIADIVLVCQVFYYRGFTLSDKIEQVDRTHDPESEPLLGRATNGSCSPRLTHRETDSRRPSFSELGRQISNLDVTQLDPNKPASRGSKPDEGPTQTGILPTTAWQAFFFNTSSILLVCGAGVVGWWIGNQSKRSRHGSRESAPTSSYPQFDVLGQVFGYLCTVFYLGSRVPQLLLNFRRKSTEGVSLLFFLFACLGNLTYTMSVFAYSPVCANRKNCDPGEAASIYGRYILVNLSWIIGSAGTLFLDLVIFWQFFLYQHNGDTAVKNVSIATSNGSPGPLANGN